MDKMITEKLAYILWQDRIAEEKRTDMILGDTESDWRRAEDMIKFFESPQRNTLLWANTFEDYAMYKGTYERLKCEQTSMS